MTDWNSDDHISLLSNALTEKTPDEKRIITKKTGLANNPNCKFGPTDNNNRAKPYSSGILTMRPKIERPIGLTAGQQSKVLFKGNSRAYGRDSLLQSEVRLVFSCNAFADSCYFFLVSEEEDCSWFVSLHTPIES